MKTKKRRWDIIFLSLLFIIVFSVLIDMYIPDIINKEYLYLIPVCVFTIIIIVCFIVFINHLFKLNKEIIIESDKIIITRNKKVIKQIYKTDIKKINVINDIYDKEVVLVYFKYHNKFYYIESNESNKSDLIIFIKDINYKKRSNLLLYLIQAFCSGIY